MLLIGFDVLARAGKRDRPLRVWLSCWAAVIEQREWKSLHHLRLDYPSADGVTLASSTVVTVFNVKGNTYRLLYSIDYGAEVVEVLEVITHPESDREQWKGRY